MTGDSTFLTDAERIFLIGFMGCGKSTIGRKLAAKINLDFTDLDSIIESQTGMSIADYFSVHGEKAFREVERTTLQKTVFAPNRIIATGGGTPCFFDNMNWMNANGTTVYICLSPEALAARLEHAKKERPLIKNFTEQQLIDFISAKLKEREVFYKQAKYMVNGINLTAEKLISALNIG